MVTKLAGTGVKCRQIIAGKRESLGAAGKTERTWAHNPLVSAAEEVQRGGKPHE